MGFKYILQYFRGNCEHEAFSRLAWTQNLLHEWPHERVKMLSGWAFYDENDTIQCMLIQNKIYKINVKG